MSRFGFVLALVTSLLVAFGAAGFPQSPQAGGSPGPGHGRALPQDSSAPAPDLPKGTIEAEILHPDGRPLVGHEVRLGIMYQTVAEGESRSEKFARTDPSGRVRFDGLGAAGGYSYRITLKSGPAEYSSPPIAMPEAVGHRVRLHVFPVTQNVEDALVGIRGIVYVETRDDVFQFQVMLRVINVGAITWVPQGVGMRLPPGFKAFAAERGMTDARFEVDGTTGARLLGTYTPGQHDVSFRFQLDKARDPSATFTLGLLPRVYEMRVIAAASPTMQLAVGGFEEPRTDRTQNGQRVLVTRKQFDPAEKVDAFTIDLSGLPVPGPGRWIAALLAAALAGSGLAAARGYLSFDAPGKLRRDEEVLAARELILKELVAVERARRAGELGPRAHSDAKKTLVAALARLGPGALEATRPRRRTGARRSEDSAERPVPPSTA